jgi:hypothetical protein
MTVSSATAPAVKTSRTRREKTWHANISRVVNGHAAMTLTCRGGSRVEVFGYYVTAVPSDFGTAYRLEKFAGDVEEGEPSEYCVNLDVANPEHGNHLCPCLGQQRWGHRHPCKHIRSLLKLHAEGRLPQLPARLCEVCEAAPAVAGRECLRCHDAAALARAQRCDLDDL